MALLDVSSVLLDPDFVTFVTIKRRLQVIDAHGRPALVETLFPRIPAVINSGSPNNLSRDEDHATFTRSINVVLSFKIIGQVDGFLPDIVIWEGNNFIVDSFDPYPQYGAGFYQVTCTSMDKNDSMVDAAVNTTMGSSFNAGTNSALLGIIA
jgi:hypothetical protein